MMLYIRDSEMMARGRKEGLQQGLQQGIQQGHQQGLQQGIERGKITQAVSMYRELVHYNDEQITAALMSKFGLTKEEAEKYLKA